MKYNKFEGKQFVFYVQEKHGRQWTSVYSTADPDEALAFKDANWMRGVSMRVLARLEEVA